MVCKSLTVAISETLDSQNEVYQEDEDKGKVKRVPDLLFVRGFSNEAGRQPGELATHVCDINWKPGSAGGATVSNFGRRRRLTDPAMFGGSRILFQGERRRKDNKSDFPVGQMRLILI